MTVRFSADLYNIAWPFVSTEETRYYLNGVLVTPAKDGGVLLVASDGRALICIRDAAGEADKDTIVRLAPKRARDLIAGASVIVDDGAATVDGLGFFDGDPTVIDGTYPDWRKLLRLFETLDTTTLAQPYLRVDLVERLARAGRALAQRSQCAMRIVAPTMADAALVLWTGVDHAFSLVMPMTAAVVEAPERRKAPDIWQAPS